MNRVERIGSVSASRLLVEFSVPSIIAMISQSVCGIMERIYAGNGAGPSAIGGITFTFPVIAVFMAFGMLIGCGGSSLYAIRLGQGKRRESVMILRTCLFLVAAISLLLAMTTAFFEREILVLSGAAGESLEYASSYLDILLAALPLQAVCLGMNNFIRSDGRPVTAMVTILIGSVGSVIISPVFIFIFHMGIRGPALGCLVSQLLALAWVARYFIRRGDIFADGAPGLFPVLHTVRQVVYSGAGPFFMQLCAVAVSATFNHQIMNYGSETDVSLFGILRSVSVFLLMPALAITQAAQPILGCSRGSGNTLKVRQILVRAASASVIIPFAGVCCVMLYPGTVTGLFSSQEAFQVHAGIHPLAVFVSMLPLAGLQVCSGGYFLATGRPVRSAMLTVSRQAFFLIPLLFLLPHYLGINGIWLAQPLSDVSAFILSLVMLRADRCGSKACTRGLVKFMHRPVDAACHTDLYRGRSQVRA